MKKLIPVPLSGQEPVARQAIDPKGTPNTILLLNRYSMKMISSYWDSLEFSSWI